MNTSECAENKEENQIFDYINNILQNRRKQFAQKGQAHLCLKPNEKEQIQDFIDQIRISTFYRRKEYDISCEKTTKCGARGSTEVA